MIFYPSFCRAYSSEGPVILVDQHLKFGHDIVSQYYQLLNTCGSASFPTTDLVSSPLTRPMYINSHEMEHRSLHAGPWACGW